MRFGLACGLRDTAQAGANAAAVRLGADGSHLDPVISRLQVATQKLGKIIDGIYHDIQITVVVEVSEGTTSRVYRCRNTGAGLKGNVFEMQVAQIAIKQLALGVAGFGLELLNFGIDVAVADQDVGPAAVVHVEKSAPPSQIL